MSNISDLVTAVATAFDEYPFEKLEFTFYRCRHAWLRRCVAKEVFITSCHIQKEKLSKARRLSDNLRCDPEAYSIGLAKIHASDVAALDAAFENEVEFQRSLIHSEKQVKYWLAYILKGHGVGQRQFLDLIDIVNRARATRQEILCRIRMRSAHIYAWQTRRMLRPVIK